MPRSLSRPRVLRLLPELDYGGVETLVVAQAELMQRERFDYRVCTFWKKGAAARHIEALGVRVDTLECDPNPRNPRAFPALAAYVAREGFDVVHASVVEANVHAGLLRTLPGAPAVAIEEVGMVERRLRSRVVFGAAYRLADVVVGVSRRTVESTQQQHWLPARKLRLIYNTINQRFFAPALPQPGRTPMKLLAVARLVKAKNHVTLLRALAAIPPGERPHLTIAGKGPLREELEASAKALGVDGAVTFAGYIDDVRPLLDDADAYLMPSFSEGTSVSLAEAMARVRPVLTSRTDGIDEVMEGYEPGWQVPVTDVAAWADGIRRLQALRVEDRERLGQLGRSLVTANMSVTGWHEKFEALYEELARLAHARRQRLRNRLLAPLWQRTP